MDCTVCLRDKLEQTLETYAEKKQFMHVKQLVRIFQEHYGLHLEKELILTFWSS
jgi:hypothetical protein